MNIGIAGPITPSQIAGALGVRAPGLPIGMGGTAVTSLVIGLARAGHSVVVYSLSPDVTSHTTRQVGSVRFHFGPYRERARDRAADFFRAERAALAGFVRADPVDVVNAHWTYEFALGALEARADTVITVRDWAPLILKMQPTAYRLVRMMMNRRCLQKAHTLTCTSPYMREMLLHSGQNASLTPNMVSSAAFMRAPRVERSGSTVVCVSNGYAGWKNVGSLVKAMPYLADSELLLVGHELDPGGPAEAESRRLGVQDRVRCLGSLEYADVLGVIASADVLVHPSIEESFGNVLVEAMALGVPVVGGRRSGAVPWVLDEGEAGVLVDIRSPRLIAEAVSRLLDDAETWSHFSQAGRVNVETRFSEYAVTEAYLSVYRQVLGG
mgnify:CR=1 FL=1